MNKKALFGTISALALIAAAVMYKVGNSSSHLSELKDFWWVPLPLAVICLVVAAFAKPKA